MFVGKPLVVLQDVTLWSTTGNSQLPFHCLTLIVSVMTRGVSVLTFNRITEGAFQEWANLVDDQSYTCNNFCRTSRRAAT
jgi:hypothetical protein